MQLIKYLYIIPFDGCGLFNSCENRELTLKCKLKCYEIPMKDPLGVSPSTGNQGTTRGKENFF